MLNGNGKLSSVSTTNVCRRDGDVLLGTNTSTNTLEDELHTWGSFATQNKTYINITTIYVKSMG